MKSVFVKLDFGSEKQEQNFILDMSAGSEHILFLNFRHEVYGLGNNSSQQIDPFSESHSFEEIPVQVKFVSF